MGNLDLELSGKTEKHLSVFKEPVFLHKEVVEPFLKLQKLAHKEGIELAVASGFRSFDRQCLIWNTKARGERPLVSHDGTKLLDFNALSKTELLFAILRWSALPGTSRHHWGTDMDVWDIRAVQEGYQLQLVTQEYDASGPFGKLSQWLESSTVRELGFVRPYHHDTGGVSPEPWHISFLPVARSFEQLMNKDKIAALISDADIELKGEILNNLDHIVERFIVKCPD